MFEATPTFKMATRGRGRGSSKGKSSHGVAPSERKPKSPKSLEELSEYLTSLNEGNISHYGQMFADMVLEFTSKSTDNLDSTIELIFSVTTESREYTPLGAAVCQKIVTCQQADSDNKKTQRVLFRKSLLERFQSEFSKRDSTRKVSIEAWLTIFSFLCDIFRVVQVNDAPISVVGKAILSGMEWLLKLQDSIEDETECVCEKLKQLGKALESISPEKITSVVSLLRSKVISRHSSCRVRCIVLEIIEYRAMGWTDRNNELDNYYMDAIADATVEDDLSL